jgi:DNA mismatch repair ATPase MutS
MPFPVILLHYARPRTFARNSFGCTTGDNPISQLLEDFALCEEELSLLRAAIAEDPPATLQNIGVIRDGYSAELMIFWNVRATPTMDCKSGSCGKKSHRNKIP